jgi:hypothetical protein
MCDAISIEGLRFIDGTDNLIVNEKRQVIGLPIDLIKRSVLSDNPQLDLRTVKAW